MHFKMLSAICFNFDKSKILSSGNGLMVSIFSHGALVKEIWSYFLFTDNKLFCSDNFFFSRLSVLFPSEIS